MNRDKAVVAGIIAAVLVIAVVGLVLYTTRADRDTQTDVVVEQPEATTPSRPAEEGSGTSETPSRPAEESSGTSTTQPTEQPSAKVDTDTPSKPAPKAPEAAKSKLGTFPKDKPTMVEFAAEWCPPCRQMKPVIEDLKKTYSSKAEIITIDIDKEKDLARTHKITAVPTQVFLDKSGKEVSRHQGFYPKDQIVAQLEKMGAKK